MCSICRDSEYEALGINGDEYNNDFYSAVQDINRNDEYITVFDNSDRRNGSRDDLIKDTAICENGDTDRLLSNCSAATGHPSLLDSASDYNCDSMERISEFSFDMSHDDKQSNKR